MPGESWRQAWQIAKEVTPGVSVPATRKMYFLTDQSSLGGPGRSATPRKFAVGRRSSQLAVSRGPLEPGGTIAQIVDPKENLELYMIGLQGSVSPTGVSPNLIYTFTPGNNTPDTATIEWNDGDEQYESAGVHANTLRWAGEVSGDNVLTAELFGRTFVLAALTGSLADRTPTWKEGWETRLFIDALGGTAGTTAVTDALISWDVSFSNNLQRKYFANNSQNVGGLSVGEFDVSASLVLEGASATAAAELANATANTQRLVQLRFGPDTSRTELNIPGVWTAEDLGGTDRGTRVYRMTLTYIYDSTNAYGFQVKAYAGDRASAF